MPTGAFTGVPTGEFTGVVTGVYTGAFAGVFTGVLTIKIELGADLFTKEFEVLQRTNVRKQLWLKSSYMEGLIMQCILRCAFVLGRPAPSMQCMHAQPIATYVYVYVLCTDIYTCIHVCTTFLSNLISMRTYLIYI